MTTFDVFRCQEGPRAGNVDYLGQILAETPEAAEDQARLMFDCDPSCEHFSIEEADEES